LACALALLLTATMLAGCGRGDSEPPRASVPAQKPDPAVVQTTSGAVRGMVTPDFRLFEGIPYAAPPVGPLRWQPPAPAAAWAGVRDATRPGRRCIQDITHDPDFGLATSEDCLTLNVWTPSGATVDSQRPVMVWIHGGAFANGSGDIYNARWLAKQGDIVVVTINYRLGTMGFLAHPALARNGEAGNYGLEDQQAALRWVHDNIGSFGGDPAKVTIAGESAGAMSVCDHLVAPASAGLFRAAILQSGPCQVQAARLPAQQDSAEYGASVGCADLRTAAECLRALPPTKLERPPWYVGIGSDRLTGPVTGTEELPIDPMTAFAQGRAARVPVLIGVNHDEFTLFTAMQYLRLGKLPGYSKLLADTFGDQAGRVADRYPLDRYGGSAALAYSAAVTDGVFACPSGQMAAGLVRGAPVYGYEFNDPNAPAPDPLRQLPFPVGASHSLELRYLFDIGGAPPLTPAQRTLSDQMIDYWSSFVTTGVPRVTGQPEWPAMGTDVTSAPRMSLQTDGLHTFTNFDELHQCPFWATVKS
jgi:para-nitrobenzyl esterase